MDANNLKLFVWQGVLCDYTSGIAFALAKNVEEAREAILVEYRKELNDLEFAKELEAEPIVAEVTQGFFLFGGG